MQQIKSTGKAIAVMGLLLLLSACSVKGNIEDITEKLTQLTLGMQTGLTSGSQQNVLVNGYRVSATLGDMSTGVQQKLSNGYTVYGSVVGNVNSETEDVTYR